MCYSLVKYFLGMEMSYLFFFILLITKVLRNIAPIVLPLTLYNVQVKSHPRHQKALSSIMVQVDGLNKPR